MAQTQATGEITERTFVKLPVSVFWGVILGIVTAAFGVVAARDGVLRDMETTTQRVIQEERERTSETLRHYPTRDELLQLLDARFERWSDRIVQQLRSGHR